jgi:sugar lactone lactonase YvrE
MLCILPPPPPPTPPPLPPSSGFIFTVAGNGSNGFSLDGGPATSVQLDLYTSFVYNSPAVVIDSSGNLYIADYGTNRIRMVNVSSGDISTFAGTGIGGSTGDGKPATSAQLGGPTGLALDSSGNLYISEYDGNRIRKIDGVSGNISTIAGTGNFSTSGDGGPATSASLFNPNGLALDSSGNVYVASDDAAIRMINVSSGNISRVAGNGNSGFSGDGGSATLAKLYFPHGCAVDSSGNVYIADSANNRVRMVNVSSGIISTVTGNGSQVYSGDGGPAVNATVNYPEGVALDSSGNLYISDFRNNVIRKVDIVSGIISTVAGNGSQGYSGDGGLATSATLHRPTAIAFDSSGNYYIVDEYNYVIRKVYL